MKKIILVILFLTFLISCKQHSSNKENNNVIASNFSNKDQYGQENTILIANITALSGKASKDHKTGIQTIQLAVEEVNRKGGVLGKKINLKFYDNKSTVIGSKLAAEKAVKDGVLAIIGCTYSSYSLAVAPVAQKAKIPMISDVSTNPDVTKIGDYIFRVCFIDEFQGKLLATFVKRDLKKSRVAVLTDINSDYSIGLTVFFIKEFEKLQGKIVLKESFKTNAKNFENQLNQIKKEKVEVLFIPAYAKESGLIIKQALKMGLKPIFLGGDGWSGKIILDYAGENIPEAYFLTHWSKNIPSEENIRYLKKYYKKYGTESLIDPGAILTNDAFNLLVNAIERAREFDKKKIKLALQNTNNFKALSGNISFDKNGDPIKNAVINRISDNKIDFFRQVRP